MTKLNEEALEVAARATYEMRNPESWARDWEELGTEEREEEWVKPARVAVSAYLSALPESESADRARSDAAWLEFIDHQGGA